jgi:glycosyltransferase involved in cell wall biosynthesis
MVRALKNEKFPVVFIGSPVSGYEDYFQQCKREAGSNIHFLGGLSPESGLLKSAYAACRVFLLASWLETPGLAALEAALAGAPIVITKEGATREYFGDDAGYVSPNNLDEIRSVTQEYYEQGRKPNLSVRVAENYSWEKTAKQTLEAYQTVLDLAKV